MIALILSAYLRAMATVTIAPKAHRQSSAYRATKQLVSPASHRFAGGDSYNLYPAFPLEAGAVSAGFDALARELTEHRLLRIDGYVGVFWSHFRHRIQEALAGLGVEATWIDVSEALKRPAEIESLLAPFLGADDPLFGTRFTGALADFFDADRLTAIGPDPTARLTILYGCGSAFIDWDGPLMYADLPKNELQYRSRAGTVLNLGAMDPAPPKYQYKRFYFVDWPALNQHKAKFIERVDWFVDGQRPDEPTFIAGTVLREALDRMSRNVFRVRPWFEAGPWGGQWLKSHVAELPQDEPNYAWSFEMISPENGIALGDGQHLCEVSFDWLMYRDHHAVLGDCADRFGYDFPIRFDFLDTFDGGNLSLQCHPRPGYIREHFGEPFTQDETYYIVDCKPGAEVYLGFRQGVDSDAFRAELERSYETSAAIDVKQFVNTLPVHRHDLFLIPSGTIHCSGANTLVLEISATPYIFTFKMYDWLRMGLDGVPRPLNIDRAFDNLCFERQGESVTRQLVSHPRTIAEGEDWRVVHLPTHHEHFYDVHRYEFDTEVVAETNGSPHILMLVEGSSLFVETAHGMRERFNFVETFVVPAAAGSYKLINQGKGRAKVVMAFVKPHPMRGT
ncbi:MAG TPA: class I mannose-6-phosphate isomerase [Pirellulaceae bacterium]|nr:class I mannose-6-phosphate isomerase [Pirellulaceae bacterium]